MMFHLYSFLYALAVLVLFLPEYLKRQAGLRSGWLREKLGILPLFDSCIWIHAVSVGEVGAAVPLLKKLQAEYPSTPLVLSTITDTGQRVAAQKAPEGATVVYLPFDVLWALRLAFRRTRPKLFITIETEIWPNLFRALSVRGVPILVLNGRISEKSAKGYRILSFFIRRVLGLVSAFGMQSEADAKRLEGIGADSTKIFITGNFKFDMEMPAGLPPWAEGLRGPVIVAGSTHGGEEEIILSAFRENIAKFPGLKLILAPRHPERFQEVEATLKASGMVFIKRSEMRGLAGAVTNDETSVILLDTIGELSSVYGLADIAIIGKSLLGKGGQNPLEPACWGKPVICGPHMENFPFIRDFIREGAAFEVEPSSIAKKIRELLVSPDKARAAGEKGRELCLKKSGAVGRSLEIVRRYLE